MQAAQPAQNGKGPAGAPPPATEEKAKRAKSAFTPDPEIVAINKLGKILSSLEEPYLGFVKDWLKRKLA